MPVRRGRRLKAEQQGLSVRLQLLLHQGLDVRGQNDLLGQYGVGLNDPGDAPRPAGLVAGADTGTAVAVKVFIE